MRACERVVGGAEPVSVAGGLGSFRRGRRADRTTWRSGLRRSGKEEIAEVVATLRSGWIGTGPRVQRFEREFAGYVGSPQAVA